MARPEGDARSYNPDPYDQDAWQDFTPWRPGDPSPADEAPTAAAADNGHVHRGRPRETGRSSRSAARSGSTPAADADSGKPRRWWTEDVPTVYEGREQVRATNNIGGMLFQHVPAGTKGVVDHVEKSLLGEDKITVRFENGYTETVRGSDIEKRSWWD